jgi:hypothetical protein
MLSLSFVFVAFGGSPIRDFFQISSDADPTPLFVYPNSGWTRSRRQIPVRSITCAPCNPLDRICSARGDDNSRLTSSSSSPETKTTTSPDLCLFSWFEASRILPEGLFDGAGCFGCAVGLTEDGPGLRVFLQPPEEYLSSDV